MYEEVEKLEDEIAITKKPKAFDICRRGALYRKVIKTHTINSFEEIYQE